MRIESAEVLYHVMSTGKGKRPIFKGAVDRGMLLNMLEEVNDRFHWFGYAHCLTTNHYNLNDLIIETPHGNLSKGMQQLNDIHTIHFNRHHGGVGHVFQGRYKAIPV